MLPLSGRLARDRSCLWAADEHADRPRSCRSMLRQHMLIMHATVGGDPYRSTGLADVSCARATFYAHERLYVSSYYLCASPVCVGPAEVAVYGRTEE